MSRTSLIGLFGGVLIALSVFFASTSFSIDAGALSGSAAILTFVAGVLVAVFIAMKRLLWALMAAIVATTIALIGLLDVIRAGGDGITVGWVVLLVGVILALIATVPAGRRKN